MTYDLHGAWEPTTNFQAPLYGSSGDPSQPPANNYNANYAVQAYKNAGVPAAKIVLGVPFYGRGWTNVPNVNNGLYQPSSTAAPGTYEAGIEDYKVLKNLTGYGQFRHPEAQAFWIFNGSTFWSYDDPTSLTNKMNYIKAQGLGGAMFWEASGDDATGSLVTAIYNGLR
jgi:chitinase